MNTIKQDDRLKICVIGGGISGITAAWLLSRRHDVTLIEKEPRLGGHACTHTLADGTDKGMPVNMGFIVLDDRTYPTLHALFKQWGVCVSYVQAFEKQLQGIVKTACNACDMVKRMCCSWLRPMPRTRPGSVWPVDTPRSVRNRHRPVRNVRGLNFAVSHSRKKWSVLLRDPLVQ